MNNTKLKSVLLPRTDFVLPIVGKTPLRRERKRFFCKNWGLIWLPLTRELASAARLRERKSCVFCSFTPSLPSSRQSRATSQLPFRSVLLSLRLEIATGNPHPRQREARIVETPTFRIEPRKTAKKEEPRLRVCASRLSTGDPDEIRTRVTAVKGRCLRPLDHRADGGCNWIRTNDTAGMNRML